MFTDDIHFHLHAMKLFNEALRDIFKEKNLIARLCLIEKG